MRNGPHSMLPCDTVHGDVARSSRRPRGRASWTRTPRATTELPLLTVTRSGTVSPGAVVADADIVTPRSVTRNVLSSSKPAPFPETGVASISTVCGPSRP